MIPEDSPPTITPEQIRSKIVSAHYFTALDGAKHTTHDFPANKHQQTALSLLTFCVLVLENGFTITGQSACASPEKYNQVKGKAIAYENAIQQVWPLLGYELKQKLWENQCQTQ